MSKYNLTFSSLRTANVLRLPQFKNAKGAPAHSRPDGSDWSLDAWCNAALGELGEAANIIKKVRRGDLTLDEARPLLAKELADVVTYVDILAYQLRVGLGDAVAEKFNEISRRVGATVEIARPYRIVDTFGALYSGCMVEHSGTEVARPLGEPPHADDPL